MNCLMTIFPEMEGLLKEIPEKLLYLGIRIVLALVCFWLGMQITKLLRKVLKKALEKANADTGVIQFLDSFLKLGVYILLAFLIASGFGVDAASIIAVVGSAGVAIGLALQGSLSNLAGGVLILLLKPFKVGDYIKEDAKGNEGTVTEIQIFYTKLTTGDNRVVVLPNGTLANSSITNVTHSTTRRIDIPVSISYDADIRTAKQVLYDVVKKDEAPLEEKDIIVYVDSLGDSAVNLGVRCWVKREDYWKTKCRLTENIKYALDDAKIGIPYPQLDVHHIQ